MSRFDGSRISWDGCVIELEACRLDGVDLSGLTLNGGGLRLSKVVIEGAGLIIENLRVAPGAEIAIAHAVVRGPLSATGLVVESGGLVQVDDLSLDGDANADFSSTSIAIASHVALARTRLGVGSALRMRNLEVAGRLDLGELQMHKRSALYLDNLRCRSGQIYSPWMHVGEGARLRLSGLELSNGGGLWLEHLFINGIVSASGEVAEGSLFLLEELSIGSSGNVVLHVYNKSGSFLGITGNLDHDAVLCLSACENEGAKSTLVLIATMHSPEAKIEINGGGNYGAHTDLEVRTFQHRGSGTLAVGLPISIRGAVNARIDSGISVVTRDAVDNDLRDLRVRVQCKAEAFCAVDHLRSAEERMERATRTRGFTRDERAALFGIAELAE